MVENMSEQMSMQDLLLHMEKLQKRTEDNMTKTIHNAVDKSKKEINDNISTMITTLTKSVDSVKQDRTEMQQKYDSRLEKLQEDFMDYSAKLMTRRD